MKINFSSAMAAFAGVALAFAAASCCCHGDPDYSNVVPPTIADVHVISGSVAAISGDGIEGATITMTGAENGTATTDANGYFVFNNVKVGDYHLEVTAAGKLPKSTDLNIANDGDGKNAVWNVMLVDEAAVTSIPVVTAVGAQGEVTSESLKDNDMAQIPVEAVVPANALSDDATITVAPIYTEEEAVVARVEDDEIMLIGATISCDKEGVRIVTPLELSFDVDPETIAAIRTQKYENGVWVDVPFTANGDKVIVAADEFTSYGIFGAVKFTVSTTNTPLTFTPNEWDNLYGNAGMNVTESTYGYKVGMDIQSKGTTVFTALLIECLARHFGANSYDVTGTYPINVTLPIGTYLSIKGVQEYNKVTAALDGRSVYGLQYGDVTVTTLTTNRQHNGGSSRPF